MTDLPINPDESPALILDLIYRLKIKDVMTKKLICAEPTTSLREIQEVMREKGITGVPIAEEKRIVGIISVDDIIRALDGGYVSDNAEKHMTKNLIVLEDDMPLSFAINYIEKYHFGRFPVLNKKRELVGIITNRDISRALLVELNKEVIKLEKKIPKAKNITGDTIALEFPSRKFDFENAGKASTEIKKILKQRNLPPKFLRRVAVAAYELEMNQVVHSEGGKLIFSVDPDVVTIRAIDVGPGIPSIEDALTEGFSTANEWVRSLGFGAGMGLPNVKRVTDTFDIKSSAEEGTTVIASLNIPKEEQK